MEFCVYIDSSRIAIKEVMDMLEKFLLTPKQMICDWIKDDLHIMRVVGTEEDYDRLIKYLTAKFIRENMNKKPNYNTPFVIYTYHPILEEFKRQKRFCHLVDYI